MKGMEAERLYTRLSLPPNETRIITEGVKSDEKSEVVRFEILRFT